MDIVLNLNSTQNAIDVLKYCVLYFDKVSVDMPYFIETVESIGPADSDGRIPSEIHFTPYCSNAILSSIHFLENEGLVITDEKAILRAHDFNMLAKDIVGDNLNLLFKKEDFEKRGRSVTFSMDAKLISEEAMEAISEIVSEEKKDHISRYKFKGGQVPDFYLAMSLYVSLLQLLLAHMSLSENTICNSTVLNNMVGNSLNRVRKKRERNNLKGLAMLNAMKILLPNISEASLEDILDIRLLAKDELIEMRAYIDSTLKELSNEGIYEMSPTDISRLVEQKITPTVSQFERKLQDIRLSSVQSFIKGIQNPLSYAPLITTFFAQVPAHITLLASLGLISFEAVIEYIKNRNSLKNNPLYFTIPINRRLR